MNISKDLVLCMFDFKAESLMDHFLECGGVFSTYNTVPCLIFVCFNPVTSPSLSNFDISNLTVCRCLQVNNFGGRLGGNGCFVFNRKTDLLRAAFMVAVERHLHPPPHK